LEIYLDEIIKRKCFERSNITSSMVFLYFINTSMVNIYEWRMKDLKVLHKLQRAQQLMLKGETEVPYELVDEVIVEILDEKLKDAQEYQHTYGSTYE
jgi:hypothetical protein